MVGDQLDHLGTPVPDWPRRLLHIPSMTSFSRTGESTYSTATAPEYNILSYTWGRWKLSSGPALSVKGLSWSVPAVDPSHFSVPAFQRVISHIGAQDTSFLWVDIACIDQTNTAIKMSEIGKQAAIFDRARNAYIWLSHLEEGQLRGYMQELEIGARDASAVGTSCVLRPGWVESMIALFKGLLLDPWFSSLWTLQEAFLRRDAVLLSQEGRVGGALIDVLTWAAGIYRGTLYYSESSGGKHDDRVDQIKVQTLLDLIMNAGLYSLYCDNPVVLYSVARYRRTRHPLDRIYAIMQVYGLRLGQSAEPEKEFTLEDLEDQLGIELNKRAPIRAQLYVFTTPQEVGRGWRISPFTYVPEPMRSVTERRTSCTFGISPVVVEGRTWGYFRSRCAAFASLAEKWLASSRPNRHTGAILPVQRICLDVTDLYTDLDIPKDLRPLNPIRDQRQNILVEKLVARFGGQSLRVLLLGVLMGHAVGKPMETSVGLIVVSCEDMGTKYWRRLGIVLWEDALGVPKKIPENLWQSLEGLLG
ncbi:hypothetical protein BDD12DRAFT_899752 [Trichophaea hybrida]|nr:hypothetical protein BDD12DRAFT_899752 [Trichophaea hybrida]